jgi:hypothetical protein
MELRYDPNDDGVQLNFALSRLLGGETQRANALFAELHREYGRDGICQKIEVPPEQEAREQNLALVSKLYQVLDQLNSEQPLDVSISPTDVHNRSRGLYWKRR